MSNQYSYGCGYNYRRSSSREVSGQCSRGNCSARSLQTEQQPMLRTAQECMISQWPIAMGYVPVQVWSQPVSLCRGLRMGTIFADLDKPFCGKGGARK